MRAGALLAMIALTGLAARVEAKAQQPAKVPRIGVLISGLPSTHKGNVDAFRQGLRDLGYVEGQNIVIEYRYAEGRVDRFPDLAAELVRLKPDVLVTAGTPGVRALMNATNTIPIVMAAIGDAVASGFVQSLARPGGNITGLSFLDTELSVKRLELLKEDGGLMSYSASISGMFRRASTYVDKILNGTKPADIPVEQPTRFEFVINMKTAKALGLTLPPSIMVRADQVIQ